MRRPVARCDVFEASAVALFMARACRRVTGTAVEPLHYRLIDVRDEDGLLLRLRIAFDDLARVQAEVLEDPVFRAVAAEVAGEGPRCSIYLAKAVATISFTERGTLWRTLLTIQICAWHRRRLQQSQAEAILFLQRQPWLRAISRYAGSCRVTLVPVAAPWHPARWLRRRLPAVCVAWLRRLNHQWHLTRLRRLPRAAVTRQILPTGTRPRIAVDYYGQLNLRHPERYSDLFFWQQASVPAKELLVTFKLAADPLDAAKWEELAREGMSALVLHPRAMAVAEAPLFTPTPASGGKRSADALAARDRTPEARWLCDQLVTYRSLRHAWAEVVAQTGIKIYVTWFKYDAWHCAIADAMQQAGGLIVIYQRALDVLPSAETMIAADIAFGFSPAMAELERQSRSQIAYQVTTGYLGDHRVPLLRTHAAQIRDSLQQHGATRIIAFTDENSLNDSRWHTGHELQRQHYAFLLEQVLANPWLGIVVKPKVPSNLRQRLGPVARLLARAEATGRCYVYETGVLHGTYPPVAAALASDVAIHGHLCGATAGLEAALAGVPTVMMDLEGWSVSPLYRLGVGRVVFTDWPSLWKGCLEHWAQPGGVPGFGDWQPLLNELDPFRDGRAAERMGTYLQWLLEGFDAGLRRDTVMADAAERYTQRWGKDKVTRVDREVSMALALEEVVA